MGMNLTQKYRVSIEGREEIELHLVLNGKNEIIEGQLVGVGGIQLLALLETWRPKLKGPLQMLAVPQGNSVEEILLRELLMKAQGLWKFPYNQTQMCHCRSVSTEIVDRAIVLGADTVAKVSRLTSASTACGTCAGDVQSLIDFRHQKLQEKKSAA